MFQSIQALREAEDKKLKTATEAHAKMLRLLAALPAQSPSPRNAYIFGYCAEYGLEFDGQVPVDSLLALYPPLDVVDVIGNTRTQKPVKYLRGSELADAQVPLFPVLYKSSPERRAQWWTALSCGDVQIQVLDVKGHAGMPDVEVARQDQQVFRYSTGSIEFFTPKLATVPAKLSPMTAWAEAWNIYSKAAGLNPKQCLFMNTFKALVVNQRPLPARNELPEPHYLKAGSAIAFGPGEDLLEGIQKLTAAENTREEHWLDKTGDFWAVFTPQEADALLEFANSQEKALSEAQRAEDEAEESVRAALRGLMAQVSE